MTIFVYVCQHSFVRLRYSEICSLFMWYALKKILGNELDALTFSQNIVTWFNIQSAITSTKIYQRLEMWLIGMEILQLQFSGNNETDVRYVRLLLPTKDKSVQKIQTFSCAEKIHSSFCLISYWWSNMSDIITTPIVLLALLIISLKCCKDFFLDFRGLKTWL